MLETLQQDYIRTAKAKGLRYRRIVVVHTLRNSLIPVVTAAGPILGFLITGSFIVEQIFAIPGIGRVLRRRPCTARDYSVVMGLTVLLSMIVIIANLVVDILYGILDPRTRDASDLMATPAPRPRRAAGASRSRRRRRAGRRRADHARSNLWKDAWYRYIAKPGAARRRRRVRACCSLYCLIWPFVSPYDPYDVHFAQARQSPSLEHPLGTDTFGRDLLTRTALGGRISIGIGFAATIVILAIGVAYGSISGLRRRPARQRDDALPRRALRAPVPAVRDHHARRFSVARASGRWWSRSRSPRGSRRRGSCAGQIITLKQNDYVRAANDARGSLASRPAAAPPAEHARHPRDRGLPGAAGGDPRRGLPVVPRARHRPPDASWGSMAQEGYKVYRVFPLLIIIPSVAIATLDPVRELRRRRPPRRARPEDAGDVMPWPSRSSRSATSRTHFFTREGVVHAGRRRELRASRRGKTLGIVGESGCGKTVTALSVMGLIPKPPARIVARRSAVQGARPGEAVRAASSRTSAGARSR